MISQLLAFARKDHVSLQSLSLNAFVKEALNLVNNAHDALQGVVLPEIVVELTVFTPNKAFKKRCDNRKIAEKYAHLSVRDNGCGMSHADRSRVFEPFFTTKEQGKGTGLGLSMVFGAVHTHHGVIEVDSEVGHGSTFHIYLPLQQRVRSQFDMEPAQEILRGDGETILLADDEVHVREVTGEMLEELGYRVILAADGVEAVSLFRDLIH